MKIPVDEYGWIKYNDNVFIIKIEIDSPSKGNFQCDGTMCKQASISGTVVKKFKTKSKWFNPEWWYKKTCWSNDPDKIYFHTKKDKITFDWLDKHSCEKAYAKATKLAKPVSNIIKALYKEIKSKTGMELTLDSKDINYGSGWCEAFLPSVDKNGTHYLVTWANCD
jgi:hypothetical protein